MYNTFIGGSFVTQCIIHSLEVSVLLRHVIHKLEVVVTQCNNSLQEVCYSMYNAFIIGSLLLNV